MQVQAIYDAVQSDFSAVNALISEQLFSKVPLVEKIGHYIVESGGKRMRPLVVLLTCNAINAECSQDAAKLATIIEFLHTATLLHDDVVDTSELRRGKSTANAKWGNAPSVLVGDFLYSRAFQLMVELGSLPVMKILANATNEISEGEVLQLLNCKNPDVSEAHYMEVIRCKTAMLFQAASQSAAVIAGASGPLQKELSDYGLHLGLAFQLIDDVLDYTGNAEEMGKNVGDDLAEGKPTLPLIYAMREGSTQDSELIRTAIRKGGLDNLSAISQAVQQTGALEYTRQQARHAANKAVESLANLPDSRYKQALIAVANLAIERHQ
jgi:octaprenyl-diphosphate synthase